MALPEWQRLLEAHFRGLRDRRRGERPVFALEHGLGVSALSEVEADIRSHIKTEPPSGDHWLAWIVYAAEIGYRYAGDEYWQTFEKDTPGWKIHGERNWIRTCFQRFHAELGGAKPAGPWAEWFTIICWPIRHAVLPKDLQRQLARILYDLRHSLDSDLLAAPEQLGKLIAHRSWNASSRFQNLAEDPLLVGQIAAALLIEDESESNSLLLPLTLRRIAEDLNRERLAREWLRGARRIAQRVQMRGLASSPCSFPQPSAGKPAALQDSLSIAPKLVLQPGKVDSWDLLLELPDLSPLLRRLPSSRHVLAQARCVVSGSSGRPLWRGRLLSGPQRVVLHRWPQTGQPLLRFDPSTPELDYVLSTATQLMPGPIWLFRIAADGAAYELRSLTVRPGRSYVVLGDHSLLESLSDSRSLSINCEGIAAVRLDLPDVLSQESLAALSAVGLTGARTVDVWPVGLPPVSWDGQGQAEWLTTDPIALGIAADHPLEEIKISVGEVGAILTVRPEESGATALLDIGTLPPGSQRIQVAAAYGDDSSNESIGYLDLTVREPRPWVSGTIPQGPLLAFLDPRTPTLEDLWEGRLQVEIHGPADRRVRSEFHLFQRNGLVPLSKKRLPPISLPVLAEDWQNQVDRFLRRSQDFRSAYDLAQYCSVEISAEELGRYEFKAEREFSPLRWVVSRAAGSYRLLLLDDRGSDEPLNIARYGFAHPNRAQILVEKEDFEVDDDMGGLFVAESTTCTRAVVVPPLIRTLKDLGGTPMIDQPQRSTCAVIGLFSDAWRWSEARLTGEILVATTRTMNVLSAFLAATFALIGGEVWERSERAFRSEPSDANLQLLKRAISSRRDQAGLGAKLFMDIDRYVSMSPTDRAEALGELVSRLGIHFGEHSEDGAHRGDPSWLCELALRLASNSNHTQSWVGADLEWGVTQLLDNPVVARAARFLVLATDSKLPPKPISAGPLYRGWDWG